MAKKITQNINKDAGLLDLPKVVVPTSKWITKHSNYTSVNIGEIYPVYVSEVMPKEKRRVTMGMISHMTTPIAPIFNAQYTEFRAFFVPHRLSADLLGGYTTRRSPWVKVFGEDPTANNAEIVVPLADQKLPDLSSSKLAGLASLSFKAFGGLFDALDYEPKGLSTTDEKKAWFKEINFLSMASYELIYQYCYRNQNRESATESKLYQFLRNAYASSAGMQNYDDSLHIANREKDYFTGAQPFTQKGEAISVPVLGEADVAVKAVGDDTNINTSLVVAEGTSEVLVNNVGFDEDVTLKLTALLNSSKGVDIEQLRTMIKLQESLEKDMMYGSEYADYINSRFGYKILEGFVQKPQEIKKVTIASEMQVILQSSSTSGESTILGTIGANGTTRSKEFEIVPMTTFPEWGYLIICAVHKAQNSYDSAYFKPKHIFKKSRFEYFAPEIEDLGYQKVDGREMSYAVNGTDPVGFNEAYAEYRYEYNRVHGMLEPSRSNALDYWTLALSNYNDIQSLYKQSKTELDRAISIKSINAPQFFDAYGFVELNDKPMKLHSIPGFDGVI